MSQALPLWKDEREVVCGWDYSVADTERGHLIVEIHSPVGRTGKTYNTLFHVTLHF